MNLLFAIAAGGALGALLRYGLAGLIQKAVGSPFPWGTVTVNVIGSLMMGVCWEYLFRSPASPALRGFIVVGFLGAFTTFSTFSLETVLLARLHDMHAALLNVFVSNTVCISAVLLGLHLTRCIHPHVAK